MTGERAASQLEALTLRFESVRRALVAWLSRRVGDPAIAEELAQACFLRVVGGAETSSDFETSLAHAARHLLFERRQQRESARFEAGHDRTSDGYANGLRDRRGKARLKEAAIVLCAMPERTRAVFLLHRLDGLQCAEIAIRLKISPSAVREHMLVAIGALTEA